MKIRKTTGTNMIMKFTLRVYVKTYAIISQKSYCHTNIVEKMF